MTDCATCDSYEFVPSENGLTLVACPDCGAAFAECPIHGQRVMTRGGRIAGKCWGCANECAQAMQWLRAHPHPRRVPLAVVA